MSLDFQAEDEAERVTRKEIHKRGKRMFVLFCISGAVYYGAELLHVAFGFPSSVKVVFPIVGVLTVFICGEAFSLSEVWFDELRTRMKEIDGKLTELKATVEDLREIVTVSETEDDED